jgi:hypothetical protein
VGEGRGRRLPKPGLTPFWDELTAAARDAPGVVLTACSGYARVEVDLAEAPAGISSRTRELVDSFPADERGARHVVIDVRNRQWLAMALELLQRARSQPPGSDPGLTPL